jgi:hypothetical protein
MVEYIPILTTLFSAYFAVEMWKHFQTRKKTYLFWWFLGVVCFGLGTLTESVHALLGYTDINFRLWFILGALLGGFPLAQGSVYLLMPRKFAHAGTVLNLLLVITGSIAILLSPIPAEAAEAGQLTGKNFSWQWVRSFSPIINSYSFVFLVGGAVYSAIHYYRNSVRNPLFLGNIFIAIGGLLPGIGGSYARFGYVEVLFVTELLGILLIYLGYRLVKQGKYTPVV